MSKKNNSLLPPGFADVLPPKAGQESITVSSLMQGFANFGYEQVKPPIIEFEASLFADANDSVRQQTFRFLDPESREMLAIRADMTSQIARIATTRLKDEPRPLRISYAGQVLRVTGEGLYQERQLAQAGAELVGSDNVSADAESVIVAIAALYDIGVKNISVDFNLPSLPKLLGAGDKLLDAIDRRDRSEIGKLAGKDKALYMQLLDCTSIEDLQKADLPKKADALVERLAGIIKIVKKVDPKLSVSVDPLDNKGFEYYTGFSFAIYSKQSDEELGRGGRYVIGSKGEHASGFSISVNSVLRVIPKQAARKEKQVSINSGLSELQALHSKGLVTIFKEGK